MMIVWSWGGENCNEGVHVEEGKEDGERKREENRSSLLAGDFAAAPGTASFIHRSHRPESAPPQLGPDGFRPLTFGNDRLTQALQ